MRPVPIADLKPRIPDIGRIRSGYTQEKQRKNGNGTYQAPVNSRTWVLTAQTADNLLRLQPDVGGTVEPWEDSKTDDKFRLITETESLDVVLPNNALSTPVYERWDGRFINRRCDGVICTGFPKDGSDPVEVPCKCPSIDDDRYHCKIKLHLSVIFPQTPIGVWRLVTTSMNAARELQASAQVISMAAQIGLPRAVLTRQDRTSGEKQYRVPVLTTKATFEQIEEAGQEAIALGRAPAPIPQIEAPPMQLPAGASVQPIASEFSAPVDEMGIPEDDDDITDAEIVEEEGPEEAPGGALSAEETAVIVQMKQHRPNEPAKSARTASNRASKKTPAKKQTKRAAKKPKAAQGETEAQPDPEKVEAGRAMLTRALLSMEPQDAEALEVVMTKADLWPIDKIPDGKIDEAAMIAAPVVEAATQGGRL